MAFSKDMLLHPPCVATSGATAGEQRVLRTLREIKGLDDWHGFHSLALPDHRYKLIGELDFVLIGPDGILCIEVKSGKVGCREGVWHFPYGTSTESPFQQVRDGMFSLRERLRENLLAPAGIPGPFFGYGVIFTDSLFDVESAEWDLRTVLDARGFDAGPKAMAAFVMRLARYWQDRSRGHRLDSAAISKIVSYLRPSFELVHSLRQDLDVVDGQLVALTDEQYKKLDFADGSPRIIVSGAAGTGKTLLAMENARRHAAQGDSVLFLAFSPIMAAYIRSELKSSQITVLSINEWLCRALPKPHNFTPHPSPADALSDRYLKVLPARYCEIGGAEEKHDVLIVDEAQDCMTGMHMLAVDTVVKGGLAHGRWRFFLDPDGQRNVLGAFEEGTYSSLVSMASMTGTLNQNCRNTCEVVTAAKLVSGLNFHSDASTHGPTIESHYYSSRDHQVQLVYERISGLLAQGISLSRITLLSPDGCLHPVSADQRLKRFGVKQITIDNVPGFPWNAMTCASVSDFKGLENMIIILHDFDAPALCKPELCYIAMTRPRSLLILFAEASSRSAVEAQMLKYAQLMTGGGE